MSARGWSCLNTGMLTYPPSRVLQKRHVPSAPSSHFLLSEHPLHLLFSQFPLLPSGLSAVVTSSRAFSVLHPPWPSACPWAHSSLYSPPQSTQHDMEVSAPVCLSLECLSLGGRALVLIIILPQSAAGSSSS